LNPALILLPALIASANLATGAEPGSLVVERIGDGSAVLTSGATPVFLDILKPDGTIAAPAIGLPNAMSHPTSPPFNLLVC
jgi:hypothetical protein